MDNSNFIKKLSTISLSTLMILSSGTTVIHAENEETPQDPPVSETDTSETETAPAQEETGTETAENEGTEGKTDENAAEEPETPSESEVTTEKAAPEETVQQSEAEQYAEGVQVQADENSPSGYTAKFGYKPENDARLNLAADEKVTGVQLVGSFRLLSKNADISENSDHGLDTYQNGDYCANVHPHTRASGQRGIWGYQWTFDMEKVGDTWQKAIPMISGAHQYSYATTIQKSDGTVRTATFDDPANLSPTRDNEAHSNTRSGDLTNSIVYGKWDPVRQSQSPNLDFVTPYEGNRGTVKYAEYAGVAAADQDLGIYLPYDYDASRAEPYKVIYTSHGAGGNETYWFAMGQANNSMDHIAAENPDQEAIIVNLDNAQFNWNYYQIGKNTVDYVIPYIEANYNVSHERKDRAFCGFSMGSMTTTYMAFHYPEVFGYFGIFSGCNIGNATFKDGFKYDGSIFNTDRSDAYLQEVYDNIDTPDYLKNNSIVFAQAGTSDTAVYANGFSHYGAYETIRDFGKNYLPAGHFIDGGLVPGSHDLYTWGQTFYNFAKNIVWQHDDIVQKQHAVTGTAELTKGSSDTASFKADDSFTSVLVDGKALNASDYKNDRGTITLSRDFLNTLAAGNHTLTLRYNDGEGTADFTIREAEKQNTSETGKTEENVKPSEDKPASETGKSEETVKPSDKIRHSDKTSVQNTSETKQASSVKKNDTKAQTPDTGDHSHTALYGGVMIMALAALAGVLYLRKRHA